MVNWKHQSPIVYKLNGITIISFLNLAWCSEKKLPTPLDTYVAWSTRYKPSQILRRGTNKSRDVYSKSSLLCFSSRHWKISECTATEHLKLTSDPRFKRSNEMLNATVVSLKRQGKGNVKHKPAIESEDLLRLKSSKVLALSSPLSLLRNVLFHVVLFFCIRVRQGPRTPKTSSFKFEVGPTDHNYATMAHDEATKNHPDWIADVSSTEKLARMYETDDLNDSCKALELFMSKLNPKCESFIL